MATASYFVRQHPHQSLEALAEYHAQVVANKVATGSSDGITHDCMSLLIALAFQIEAFINLVGLRMLGRNWRERDAYHVKLSKIAKRLGVATDFGAEPYLTLEVLKQVRDQMAHAKPVSAVFSANSDAEAFAAIHPAWYKHCEPKFAQAAVDQVSEFKSLVVAAAKLKPASLLSSVGNLN
jgi:hypothetical protein